MIMNTNNVFKSVVVNGFDKEDALKKTPFQNIMVDATSSYTNFLEKKLGYTKEDRKAWMNNEEGRTPADYRTMLIEKANISDNEFREWQIDYLNDATKNIPGLACVITIDSGVNNTRKRPYEVINVKNSGRRDRKLHVGLVGKNTGKVYWKSTDKASKSEAIKKGKELYQSGVVQAEDADVVLMPEITNPVLAHFLYTPSTGAKEGTYVFFGNVDVNTL